MSTRLLSEMKLSAGSVDVEARAASRRSDSAKKQFIFQNAGSAISQLSLRDFDHHKASSPDMPL